MTLRKRLKDVNNKVPKEITSHLIKKRSEFITNIVDARNYFTHYNPSLKNAVVDHHELFTATEKLKILLLCLILEQLGLPNEKIVNFVAIDKVFPFLDDDE